MDKHFAFNRTMLELKLGWPRCSNQRQLSFNRTMLELKSQESVTVIISLRDF